MDEQPSQPALSDPEDAFQRMLSLLKSKDDTPRFVGLALLKSVLDNQTQLRESPERIQSLWNSISPKFLDRLLRAGQNVKIPKSESRDMVDLAVAVLHTFAVLLPFESRSENRLVGRTALLINALVQSSPETTTLILETLLTIVSSLEGALELLKIKDLSPLIEIAPQQPEVLDILNYAWSNASADPAQSYNVNQQVDDIVPKLLLSFSGTDAVTLLNFMGVAIPKLNFETTQEPRWLRPLVQLLQKLVVNRPTSAGRHAYTLLAAAILQAFPGAAPQLLFKDENSPGEDTKPFSYLFINLLLIDIRSSFPNLLSQLNAPSYPATSRRLAAAFDVLSAFIGYLVKMLDSDVDADSLTMSPMLILKLRKEIAETMSLTLEYLRDRYDASIAGVAGLHPEARPGASTTSSGKHLTLTWDSIQEGNTISQDPLILASIRALAMWLREDENENLRKESASLMDFFLDLYNSKISQNSENKQSQNLDFRYPVLTALEGILSVDDGISSFISQNGWSILTSDLTTIIKNVFSPTESTLFPNGSRGSEEAMRGIEIVRVLLLIIDHEDSTQTTEEWMSLTNAIASTNFYYPEHNSEIIIEFTVALLQVAAALFSNASKGMVKRYERSLSAILGIANELVRGGNLEVDMRHEVEDVILELEEV